MKPTTKFILLKPPLTTPLLTLFLLLSIILTYSFFTTFFYTTTNTPTTNTSPHPLPQPIYNTLLHYASLTPNQTHPSRMTSPQLKTIADVIRHYPNPNILVFGLTHETPFFHAVNFNGNGRTTFVDESSYLISRLEEKHPTIEAYDVTFVTKVSDLKENIRYAKTELRKECKPVQNLLFSECKLAINDLPNHVYDVTWDVIIIDGPGGYMPNAPGRLSVIFTAGVLARSKKVKNGKTHVFVHEFDREVERDGSEEFLCNENLVEVVGGGLAHFVVEKMDYGGGEGYGFCRDSGVVATVPE
ncbi:IRX15-LIKE-like protein [Tanacetum coccineum]